MMTEKASMSGSCSWDARGGEGAERSGKGVGGENTGTGTAKAANSEVDCEYSECKKHRLPMFIFWFDFASVGQASRKQKTTPD